MPPLPPVSKVPSAPKPDFGLHTAAAVHYRTWILNPDGSVAQPPRAWKKNLILDAGLNQVATNRWAALTRYCAIGTGVPVLRRDSGATTLTLAGGHCTASAGFFVSQDVGRQIKLNTGQEMYVTVYNTATDVTVDNAGAAGPIAGTVWYVNLTGLVTETKRTGNCTLGAGDNQSTFSVDTWSHKRTFIHTAEAGPVTYREIGWSPSAGAGANLFGMDLIAGLGDSLTAGQQYKVQVTLTQVFSPTTPQAIADFGNAGLNTAGTVGFEGVNAGGDGSALASVTSSGGVNATYQELEPSAPANLSVRMALASATWAQGNLSGGTVAPPANTAKTSWSAAAYTGGSFYRDFTNVWDTTVVIAAVYGFIIGATTLAYGDKFTATQNKDNAHTWTVVFRLSWGRVLVN